MPTINILQVRGAYGFENIPWSLGQTDKKQQLKMVHSPYLGCVCLLGGGSVIDQCVRKVAWYTKQ